MTAGAGNIIPLASSAASVSDVKSGVIKTEIKEIDEYKLSINSDNTASIIDYFGTPSQLNIPENIGGYTITKVGGMDYTNSMEKVIIPDTVKIISDNAF